MALAYTTISIFGCSENVVRDDIREQIESLLPGSRPRVANFVSGPEKNTQSTTVDLRLSKDKSTREAALQKIRANACTDRSGETYRLRVSGNFQGLTVLAELDREPSFDMYFVHGLNGHAFDAFCSRQYDDDKGCMWARDLLPDDHQKHRIFGRYSTFGYDARINMQKEEEFDLTNIAREFLGEIEAQRRHDNRKLPILFVCHSLGGLVTCKRMARHLSKEIIFFGTPFGGSSVANQAKPVLTAARRNTRAIAGLREDRDRGPFRSENRERREMLTRFNQLRLLPVNDIPLIIFYEGKPMSKFGLSRKIVTSRSAFGIFGKDKVQHFNIDRDHVQMCRFRDIEEDNYFYRKVAPEIRALLRKQGLNQRHIPTQIVTSGSFPERSVTEPGKVLPRLDKRHRMLPTGAFHSSNTEAPSFAKLPSPSSNATHLGFIEHTSNYYTGRKAIPGTCDWLKEKQAFKEWMSAEADAILYIRAGQGRGKSVLSKYILEQVSATHKESGTLIVPFYCNKKQQHTSSEAIMQQIFFYLHQELGDAVLQAAKEETILGGSRPDMRFYWNLLVRIKNRLRFRMILVVDGLDQIVNDFKDESTRQLNNVVTDFLEDICSLLNDTGNSSAGQIKALFTTRPIREIELAVTKHGNLVLDVQSTDLHAGVARMIEVDVDALSKKKHLPPEIQSLIKAKTTAKAGAMYQWATAVIKELDTRNFNDNAYAQYERYLDQFSADDINSTYRIALEDLKADTNISLNDKKLLVDMIKILAFSREDLSIDDIKYALGLNRFPYDPKTFQEQLPQSLESRIRMSCGSLIEMQGHKVKLVHDSVVDFLRAKVPPSLAEFDCADEREGHCFMAIKCLLCLLGWFEFKPLSGLNHDGDNVQFFTLRMSIPFVQYALWNWTDHVRACCLLKQDDRILPVLDCFFSQQQGMPFELMQQAQWALSSNPVHPISGKKEFGCFSVDLYLIHRELDVLYMRRQGKGSLMKRATQRFSSYHPATVATAEEINLRLEMNKALYLAAGNGSVDLVKYLLKRGASGAWVTPNGKSAFMRAVFAGRPSAAILLLDKQQAFLGDRSDSDISCAQMASYHNMTEVLSKLHEKGIGIDDAKGYKGWTPLHVASQFGRIEAVKVLLSKGADPEKPAEDGSTPLHGVASSGNAVILQELFKARPNLNPAPYDNDGDTPLLIAAQNGNLAVFRELFRRQAKVTSNKTGHSILHAAAQGGSLTIVHILVATHYAQDLEIADKVGATPLWVASRYGRLDTVRFLLERDVGREAPAEESLLLKHCVDVKTHQFTPICVALVCGHVEVARALLEGGADLRNTCSGDRTLLHLAAEHGTIALFGDLVRKGLSPLARDRQGDLPWHLAARMGKDEIVRYYLDHRDGIPGFNIDDKNSFDLDALSLACLIGHTSIVQMLLDASCDHNAKSAIFGSSLAVSATLNDPSIFDLLSQKIVDFYARNFTGETALHQWAESGGHVSIFPSLIKGGLEVNSMNTFGQTPIFFAAANDRREASDLLIDTGAQLSFQDVRGRTVLDYINPRHEVYEHLRQVKLPAAMSQNAGLSHHAEVVKLFHTNERRIASGSKSYFYAYLMFAFLFVDSDKCDHTRIFMNSTCQPLRNGNAWSWFTCEGCDKTANLVRPLHYCHSCLHYMLCDDCYNKRANEKSGIKCLPEHEHIEYADDAWWNLPEGVVNEEGQSMEEWYNELKMEYLSSADDAAEAGTEV